MIKKNTNYCQHIDVTDDPDTPGGELAFSWNSIEDSNDVLYVRIRNGSCQASILLRITPQELLGLVVRTFQEESDIGPMMDEIYNILLTGN